MSPAVLHALWKAETEGTLFKGELPLKVLTEREQALDSPAYLATEILDPWYKKTFEPWHYRVLDEQMGPYLLGETVKIDGCSHDPKQYTGMLVLASRGVIKSTMLRILMGWIHLYRKLRLGEDARSVYCTDHALIFVRCRQVSLATVAIIGTDNFLQHLPQPRILGLQGGDAGLGCR